MRDPQELVRDKLQELIRRKQVPGRMNFRGRPVRVCRDVRLIREEQVREKSDDEEHDREIAHEHVHLLLEEGRIVGIPVGMRFSLVLGERPFFLVRKSEGRCGDADPVDQEQMELP